MKPSHANLQTKSLAMLLLALWLAPGVCDAVQEGMSPPQSDTNSLCTWTFCNTNWDSDWNYAARSWTNVATATPGNGFSGGYAALIDTNVPAWVCYNLVEADGSTNMTLTQGSIFLSFSPNWASADETNCGTGPGSWGQLLEVGSFDGTNGYFGLYIDPFGTNLVFACGDDQGNSMTCLSAPISWTTNCWHLLALTYSSTNSLLYIDNVAVTNGLGVAYLPDDQPQAFFLGSAGNTDTAGTTNQARGVFEELVTFDHPVDAGTVAAWFNAYYPGYVLNPLNFGNLAQPQAQFVSSAPSYMTNTPAFRAISGQGYLGYVSTMTGWSPSTNVWMTNVTARLDSNGLSTITFTVAGGTNDSLYDVFGTGALGGTNTVWSWLGQVPAAGRYNISGIPNTIAFFRLGTSKDSDHDGLTDAYEMLVSLYGPCKP